MTYRPQNVFRAKWLIQSSLDVLVALGVPADEYLPASGPGLEWGYIQALKIPLGIPASTWAAIAASPFLRVYPQGNLKTTGKVPEYRMEGIGVNYSAGPVQRSFDVTLSSQMSHIYESLRRTAELSNYGRPDRHSPVLVLDYAWPESGDVIASKVAGFPPYTVRLGLIRNINPGGPGGGLPGLERFAGVGGSGVSFEFVEAVQRRVA